MSRALSLSSGRLFIYRGLCSTCRLSVSSRSLCNSNSKSSRDGDEDVYNAKPYRIWMLRFTQENSFLSWSRNAVICAGVGATLSYLEGDVPFGNVLGHSFLDLGFLFMTVGSVHHIASSFGLRHHLKMSWQGVVWMVTYTTGIWLLYLGLIKDKLKAQHTSILSR